MEEKQKYAESLSICEKVWRLPIPGCSLSGTAEEEAESGTGAS